MAEGVPQVQLWSSAPQTRLLHREQWPLPLRHEVAVLAASNGVLTDSVYVYERSGPHGTALAWTIACSVERGDPGRMADKRILAVEPVALVYPAGSVGWTAPGVYSERVDFPRDLPHLNPVGESVPASICIARTGTQALYDQGGIASIIRELVSWLTDAAAGTLEHDGWEPAPIWGAFELSADLAWLQETAYQRGRRTACFVSGSGELAFAERDGRLVRMYADLRTPDITIAQLMRSTPRFTESSDAEEQEARATIPWFFIAGPSNIAITERITRSLDSERALRDLALWAQCDELLSRVLVEIVPRLPTGLRSHVCLLFGIWRPKPLIADIPGLAESDARRCELTACYIRLVQQKGRVSIEEVYPLRVVTAANQPLMARISALDRSPEACALVGCGALGTKVGEFLMREGIRELTLVDSEILAPHNLARHALGRASLGLPKAKEFKRHLERTVGNQEDLTCRARIADVDQLDAKALDQVLGPQSRWVIDATADHRVVRRLARSNQERPVMRIELADQGRLGLISAEGISRNPRLDDVQAVLYWSAAQRPEIAAWLRRHATLDRFMLGVGCASDTMQMPDSRVALHAASFMPSINARITGEHQGGGVGINHLDAAGQPLGWGWIEVPPFESMQVQTTDPAAAPWELRTHPRVFETIQAAATRDATREMGGYLYGRFDIQYQTLTVVEAVVLPPQHATETTLVIPPAGRTARERVLIESCCGTLHCLGSWHSHTNGNATWSARDRSQALAFARANKATPRPMVMLIISPSDRQAYLILPEFL